MHVCMELAQMGGSCRITVLSEYSFQDFFSSFLSNYTFTKEMFNLQITVSSQTQPALEQVYSICQPWGFLQTSAALTERGNTLYGVCKGLFASVGLAVFHSSLWLSFEEDRFSAQQLGGEKTWLLQSELLSQSLKCKVRLYNDQPGY